MGWVMLLALEMEFDTAVVVVQVVHCDVGVLKRGY